MLVELSAIFLHWDLQETKCRKHAVSTLDFVSPPPRHIYESGGRALADRAATHVGAARQGARYAHTIFSSDDAINEWHPNHDQDSMGAIIRSQPTHNTITVDSGSSIRVLSIKQ